MTRCVAFTGRLRPRCTESSWWLDMVTGMLAWLWGRLCWSDWRLIIFWTTWSCIYSSAPTSANKHKHSCWVCMKDPTVTPAVQMCHRGYLKSDTRGEFKAKFQKGAAVHWWPWQHSLTTSHSMVTCLWWGVVCGSAEWEGWSSSLGVVSEEAGRHSWWASSNHTYINTNIVLLAKSHSKLYL